MFRRVYGNLLVILTITAGLLAGCGDGGDRVFIQNKGSDSLLIVAQSWAEAYHGHDGSVVVAVSGGGSGTGLSALINGTADIANASRAARPEEIALLEERGSRLVQHVVGFDALAVFVHSDNPVSSMTLAQLADIYGEGGTATTWTDLGVEVPGCKDQIIVLVGRQNNSGSYAYFRQAVMAESQEYKLGTLDLHVSKDVVELVENTPCAIGYGGMAYATKNVKMVCVAPDKNDACAVPSAASAIDGSYPIARPLRMYTNGDSKGPVKTYLDWIMGEAGQCILQGKGYAPIEEISCP